MVFLLKCLAKGDHPGYWLHLGSTEVIEFNSNVDRLEGKIHVVFYGNHKSTT
jgi:hypothetical protein